jgi:hypothetical protein
MKNLSNNFDRQIKYQKYSHYLLPIAIEPLKYGKLIEQFENKYIIQLNTSNFLVIKVVNNDNLIKFYRKGDLMIEFTDSKITENMFTRIIFDQKFTFENNKLITTEILAGQEFIKIYEDINPLYFFTKNSEINYPIKFEKTYLENTYIFKNYPLESFLLFKLSLIFLIYIILFVIFPENTNEIALAVIPTANIIKLKKKRSFHSWNSIEFKIDNLLFTNELFKSKFNLFWEKVQQKFTENNHMFILFQLKYTNSDFVTIGQLQRLSINDKDWFFNWIINNMDFKSEYYNETAIKSFMFSYGFKDGKAPFKETFKKDLSFQNYKNNKLVISFNHLDYGKFISEIKKENYTQFILQTNENLLVKFNKFEEHNEIEVISGGNIICNFKDEFISDNKFVRIIDDKKFYFEYNKEILFMKDIKNKFIRKIPETKNLKNNFLTLDIETYIKDSVFIVYCISIFDGKTSNSFFLNDFKNPEELIITALKSIMNRKYNRSNVYIHNLAKFDIIFLLKYLVKLGSVKPIIHNGRIIYINFNYGKNLEYQLQFKDSLLLLLRSLDTLSKSFKVENPKSMFPHFFVNENNLNYIGEVPDLKHFDKKKIKLKDYNKYKDNFNGNWNLRYETIKYCELDCRSLFQVIFKFTEMIFDLFKKNVHHYPTLPSLAFAIYRTKFMENENIPQLSGKIANDIRSGYTGGAVDVYIPKPKPGVKIKGIDINALYPSQMQSQVMPVGKITYFVGNIRAIDLNAFGFFYC